MTVSKKASSTSSECGCIGRLTSVVPPPDCSCAKALRRTCLRAELSSETNFGNFLDHRSSWIWRVHLASCQVSRHHPVDPQPSIKLAAEGSGIRPYTDQALPLLASSFGGEPRLTRLSLGRHHLHPEEHELIFSRRAAAGWKSP